MDDLTLEQLALALKVDLEELKKNYAVYEKALKPFEDALIASQPTAEDYQLRVTSNNPAYGSPEWQRDLL